MKFIKATTTEGQTEFFNPNKIMTITPKGDKAKILMGANMYWWVWLDSVQVVDSADNELVNILKGEKS